MHVFGYIRSRAFLLFTMVFTVVLISVMLYLLGITWDLINVLLSGILLCTLFGVLGDYLLYARHLQALKNLQILPNTRVLLDEDNFKTLLQELPREMRDALGHTVWLVHQEVKNMSDELSNQKEYTELWVHEIKTPLAAIKLLLQNKNRGFVEDTSFEVDCIDHLVDQALYYARSSSVSNDFFIKEINLKTVVARALQSYAKTLIDARIAPKLINLDVVVEADAKWLQFMIEQIFSNAAKYRKPNGTTAELIISAEHTQGENGVWNTRLSIQDEGIGISASDKARVFDRAFTGENGRRSAKSTGMGLYLVRKLANKMNLSVALESQVGRGTCVSIYFSSSLHDVL